MDTYQVVPVWEQLRNGFPLTSPAMFTAKPQKNRAAATTYFDEHLSHNDYYTQNESQAGHWIGAELERLQLKEGDLVTREAFLAFCDHRHPATGEALTPRRNHDGNRRLYYDFTCSAPKSVSILAVTMNDERIVDAPLRRLLCCVRILGTCEFS